MRIFLTNDDGADAPGLAALIDGFTQSAGPAQPAAAVATISSAAEPIATTVAAPLAECGNYGTSLRRAGWARSIADLAALPPASGHAYLATPALLAMAACEGLFGPPPDLVISGINYGPNVGPRILHSGTVGAALTAAGAGVPAVAISLDDVYSTGGQEDGLMHWQTAAAVALPLITWFAQTTGCATGMPSPNTPTSPAVALNVNVPNRPLVDVKGVHAAHLAAPHPDKLSDIALLAAGYITITPLPVPTGTPFDAHPAAQWLESHLAASPGPVTGRL